MRTLSDPAELMPAPSPSEAPWPQKPDEAEMGATSPRFSRTTDLIFLAGMASGVTCTLIAAYAMPEAGLFWLYVTMFSRLLLYWGAGRMHGGRIFRELQGMALISGFLELFADHFLLHWTTSGQLVYLGNDNVLLSSPIWMPFAWTCIVTEFGYLSLRLGYGGKKSWPGVLTSAVLAGVTIGLYEYFAYRAGWWYYRPAKWMIGEHCALYIPFGEVLMFLAFFSIFHRSRVIEDGQLRAIVRGSLFGVTIFISYALAYWVLEPG